MCRGGYIPYFKINAPIFCCPFFSEDYLNSQVRIYKIVNKHTVDYHPSPSQSTSRIHPLIFLWTPPEGFISPESFLKFFLNLYIPPWLRKSFKFMVLRLLTNKFAQKLNLFIFTDAPKQNSPPVFIITPRQKKITHSSRTAFSEDLFFPSRKEGGRGVRIMGLKELPKLNP